MSTAEPDAGPRIDAASQSDSYGLREADSVPIMGLQSLTEADIIAQTSFQPLEGNNGAANAHDQKPIIGLTPVAPSLYSDAALQEEEAAATEPENNDLFLTRREDTSGASDGLINGSTRPLISGQGNMLPLSRNFYVDTRHYTAISRASDTCFPSAGGRHKSLGIVLDALADQCVARRFLTPSQASSIRPLSPTRHTGASAP